MKISNLIMLTTIIILMFSQVSCRKALDKILIDPQHPQQHSPHHPAKSKGNEKDEEAQKYYFRPKEQFRPPPHRRPPPSNHNNHHPHHYPSQLHSPHHSFNQEKRDMEQPRIIRSNEAELYSKHLYENYILIWLAQKGDTKAMKALIQRGSEVNIWNESGDTPLHTAVYWGRYETAKMLIESGAYVNIRDKPENTPLHTAVLEGHYRIAKMLIDKGAKINPKDKDGYTPLFWAVFNKDEKMIELLRSHGGQEK